MSEPVSPPTRSIRLRSDAQSIGSPGGIPCRPAFIIVTMDPILSDITVRRLLSLRE